MFGKENDDMADFQPPKKKARGSSMRGEAARFKAPISEKEMAVLKKGFVPANTQRNTGWAMRVFQEWKAERSENDSEECPEDLLDNPDTQNLNCWLSRFVAEMRRQDGRLYPPKTGVGTEIRHTPTFTAEEEQALWEKGVLGCTTPKNLQRAVFFYIGKRFCIRGGDEQRKLGPSQFVRTHDPDCFIYIEHGSKNRSWGLAELRVENKCVPCYAVPENNPQCLVFLLDYYLHKLPEFALKEDVLYCRPEQKAPADNDSP